MTFSGQTLLLETVHVSFHLIMKKSFVAVAMWAVGGEQSAMLIIKTPREC